MCYKKTEKNNHCLRVFQFSVLSNQFHKLSSPILFYQPVNQHNKLVLPNNPFEQLI